MAENPSNNRNFFRVDAYIPLISYLVPPEEKENIFSEILGKDSVPALSKVPPKKVDLSGGGMSFETAEKYVKGDIIEINMILGKEFDGVIVLHGEVVRSVQSGSLHRVAVKFMPMDERIRDIIIRFVFMREREIIAEKRVGLL